MTPMTFKKLVNETTLDKLEAYVKSLNVGFRFKMGPGTCPIAHYLLSHLGSEADVSAMPNQITYWPEEYGPPIRVDTPALLSLFIDTVDDFGIGKGFIIPTTVLRAINVTRGKAARESVN